MKTRMQTGASGNILVIAALFYFGIQWVGARTMGGNVIFSSSRVADRAAFKMMASEVSDATKRYCNVNRSQRFFFDDGDVVTPYLVGSLGAFGGCEAVRETDVTPFTNSELAGCDVLFFREFSPPTNGIHENDLATDANNHVVEWKEFERWHSDNDRFGFVLYGHTCSKPANGPA